MRIPAGLLRLVASAAGLSAIAMLCACQPRAVPQQVLAPRCMEIAAGHPQTIGIESPAAGLLRVEIKERGISLVGSLDSAGASASPVERLGTIVLAAPSGPGQHHTVSITADDSPDISGAVCVAAELIADGPQAHAELAADAAGKATRSGDWNAAFDLFRQAAAGLDRLDRPDPAAAARHAMAEIAYLRLDRKRDSFALASAALAGYRRADPVLVGALTGLAAKALLDMPGVNPAAVATTVQHLLAAAASYDRRHPYGAREIPRLRIMEGFLAYMRDDPAGSQAIFSAAARSCEQLGDWDCFAIANQNLAELAAENNNYPAALTAFADALQRLPVDLDPKLSADIWNNFGRVQGTVGLFSRSERSHRTAMQFYARLGDCPGVRRSLALTGNLLVQIGSLRDAEDYLQQAASGSCAQLLAEHLQPGADGSATRIATAAEQPCTRLLDASSLAVDNKTTVFNSVLPLANAFLLAGRTALARRCVAAAVPYATAVRSQMRLAIAQGELQLENNNAAGARADFHESLRIADAAQVPPRYEHRGTAQLGLLRAALLAGDSAAALQGGAQALVSSVRRGNIDQTITSLRLLGSAYRSAGNPAQATRTLQVAADLIEAVPIDELDGEQRATFLATQHTVFSELTDLYAGTTDDPGSAWLAFETSERGRARSLRFAITQQTQDAATVAQARPEVRYQQLLQEVVTLADSGASDLTEAIDSAARRQRTASEPPDRLALNHILTKLDATLVEYVVGTRDLFAIVLDGADTIVVRLGDNRRIAAIAANLQALLHDPETPPGEVRKASAELAGAVLWPIVPRLHGKRLFLVPDDALHTIPFSILPWSAQDPGQLVLHRVEASMLPSALFLSRMAGVGAQHTSAARFELIGDPVFRLPDWLHQCADPAPAAQTRPVLRTAQDWTQSLPRLPGSRTEVELISTLASRSRAGSHVETLLGCAAVPSSLRRAATRRIDLLHIATHARVDAQRPRLSALALTPETASASAGGFGLLDILALKLNSTLVVLSACETSRGRLLPGEGMLGPAQAFLQAGAATVIASYWRIDDREAAAFMGRFYQHLLLDHLTAAAALRRTQLESAGSAAAFTWTSFALYGWPDSSI